MDLLVVEDDPKVAASLVKGLTESGYAVAAVSSAESAVRALADTRHDMVILDLGLPGRDGYHVLASVRRRGVSIPVIILTARDSVEDRVRGLEAGADDYLVKPFAFAELLARVRVRLRSSSLKEPGLYRIADLDVDSLARRVSRSGREIHLAPREFDLLLYLVRHAGTPVTREMLAADVWQVHARATPLDNVIDVHISKLRAKVDADGMAPLIRTIRGVGFLMEA